MGRVWLGLVACAMLPSAALGALTGYEPLKDWNDLALAKTGVTAGLASSYDRLGANDDYNYYLSPEGRQTGNVETVVTELEGPGVLTRFWMPHAAANAGFTVRIIVDGVVQIDTNSNVFLDGAYGYVQSPLVRTLVGGQTSYEPIAFQESLRIESNNFAPGGWAREHHYYQYDYRLLPATAVVTPYSGTLSPEQQADRDAVVAVLGAVGSNPAGTSAGATVLATGARTVAGGESLVLGNLAGAGQVRRLNLKMPEGATDAQLDGLHLRIWYDGRAEPSVDVPVAQFFGAGHGRAAYQSLPLGTDSPDGFYAYWPMPYREGARVELVNATGGPIATASAQVEFEAGPVAGDAGYFGAAYAEETTVAGQAYHTLLSVAEGRGHYVGNLLYVERAGDSRWILEGDDIITVNPGRPGETVLYGTGLEDAYNGGYYYNHVLEQTNDGDVADPASGIGPYAGLLAMDFFDMPGSTRTRTDQYRWMVADCVPFEDGIDVRVENYGKTAGVLFGSTACYYLAPAGLVWTGAEDGTWDAAGGADWSDGAAATAFVQGDRVRFGDTGAGALTVHVADAVRPWSVHVDAAATDYTLTGPGSIDGPCALFKDGAATLTLAGANTYAGGTHIRGGTVVVAAVGALGPGDVRLGNPDGPGDAALLVCDALTVENTILVQDDGSGSSTRTLGGTNTAGTALFSGDILLAADLTLTAAPGGDVRLAGLLDNPDGHTMTKVGAGTVIFDGPQAHGPGALLDVLEGTVRLNTDAGADLSISVTDAAVYLGCDQHLDTLSIGDGGQVVFAGARVVVLKHLVMDGVDLGGMTLTPEPATLALVGAGALVALVRRRRRT